MRFLPLVPACIGLALSVIAEQSSAEGTAVVPTWAHKFLESWYVAYNNGNAPAVASLFTVDARFGPLKGRAVIAAELKRAFATTKYNCVGHFETLHQLGGLAVASGAETCEETAKPNGSAVTTKERWLIVFERQSDGRWLISRETWEDLRP